MHQHRYQLAFTEKKSGVDVAWTYFCHGENQNLCDEKTIKTTEPIYLHEQYDPVMGVMARKNQTAKTLTIHGKTYKRDMSR